MFHLLEELRGCLDWNGELLPKPLLIFFQTAQTQVSKCRQANEVTAGNWRAPSTTPTGHTFGKTQQKPDIAEHAPCGQAASKIADQVATFAQ